MVNISAKFDEEIHNGVVSIVFTSLSPYMSIVTLTFLPLTSKIYRVHPLTMANMSAKSDRQAHNGLVAIMCTSLFHICTLLPWPLTSKINRVHPLTMVNMSDKFDKEIHNGLVSIMFTSLFPYLSIVTLTFGLWPPKSIGFILSLWLTCLPSSTKNNLIKDW